MKHISTRTTETQAEKESIYIAGANRGPVAPGNLKEEGLCRSATLKGHQCIFLDASQVESKAGLDGCPCLRVNRLSCLETPFRVLWVNVEQICSLAVQPG